MENNEIGGDESNAHNYCNYELWATNSVPPKSLSNIFETKYSFDIIKKIFPWNTGVRAGIILLYNDNILLVRERERTIVKKNKMVANIPERLGIPKGAPKPCDKHMFDTAVRELKEETNISINPKTCKVSPTSITILRPNRLMRSVHIYFIVYANSLLKPIKSNSREILNCGWYNFTNEIDHNLNRPCKQVIDLLRSKYT